MPDKHSLPILLLFVTLLLISGCTGSPAAITPVESTARAQSATETSQPPAEPAGTAGTAAAPAKRVYLTFDDGPNSHFTGQVLDVLKKYGVKATFVVVGANVEKNPSVFRRIIEENHSVVNHTYSHDYKKIYASPEAFLADLERGNQSIASITGRETKIFRAPGGPANLKKNFFELLNKNGYRSLGWNVASTDSDPKGVT
ncbi:MAG: polysaccharide deacetylase family protein, partial [Firmicutes bacterium]|nr:polysaccharide deacetylase family protein [Bacillota bacterium]